MPRPPIKDSSGSDVQILEEAVDVITEHYRQSGVGKKKADEYNEDRKDQLTRHLGSGNMPDMEKRGEGMMADPKHTPMPERRRRGR